MAVGSTGGSFGFAVGMGVEILQYPSAITLPGVVRKVNIDGSVNCIDRSDGGGLYFLDHKDHVRTLHPGMAYYNGQVMSGPSLSSRMMQMSATMGTISSGNFLSGTITAQPQLSEEEVLTEMKLTIGDRVKVRRGKADEMYERFSGTAIYRGKNSRGPGHAFELESDEARKTQGGAQNGWWGLEARDLKYLEIVEPAKPKEVNFSHLDALVIDPQVKEEITSVLKQHKNHEKLFNEWGLGEVIEYGKGMTFLFYGPPGTGKTWAAHCMAKCLGTKLLTISAAEIQSSEPGAANRNIQQAFKSAKEKGEILFIDECDSLITSRADLGMVLAAEVNTLLTEIEKSEGVIILATNRIEHMDEALERRISLIAEFPAPDEKNRRLIWSKLLPAKMPLDADVNLDALAKHSLTGGQIKNVVLQAARLALAQEVEKVSLKHFDVAIKRITENKNLMGTASRYRQGRFNDFGVSMGVSKDRSISDFLKESAEKADEEAV